MSEEQKINFMLQKSIVKLKRDIRRQSWPNCGQKRQNTHREVLKFAILAVEYREAKITELKITHS